MMAENKVLKITSTDKKVKKGHMKDNNFEAAVDAVKEKALNPRNTFRNKKANPSEKEKKGKGWNDMASAFINHEQLSAQEAIPSVGLSSVEAKKKANSSVEKNVSSETKATVPEVALSKTTPPAEEFTLQTAKLKPAAVAKKSTASAKDSGKQTVSQSAVTETTADPEKNTAIQPAVTEKTEPESAPLEAEFTLSATEKSNLTPEVIEPPSLLETEKKQPVTEEAELPSSTPEKRQSTSSTTESIEEKVDKLDVVQEVIEPSSTMESIVKKVDKSEIVQELTDHTSLIAEIPELPSFTSEEPQSTLSTKESIVEEKRMEESEVLQGVTDPAPLLTEPNSSRKTSSSQKSLDTQQIPVEDFLPGITNTIFDGIKSLNTFGKYTVLGFREGLKDGSEVTKKALDFIRRK